MLERFRTETRFVFNMVKLNLASAMEYRASFLTQAIGMFLNNGIFLVFWLIFFDRFEEIRGYGMQQIFLLFGIVALGYGLALTVAGNSVRVSHLVAEGRLDYYLAHPRPVLLHVLFSRMDPFAFGDLTFGLIAFLLAGMFDPLSIVLFLLCAVCAAAVFTAFFAMVGSLAFFIGNANEWSFYLNNAMVTFALYPIGLFQGMVRIMLFTLIPAAFVGGLPVEVLETHNPLLLAGMFGIALFSLLLMTVVFQIGLRRYESGSAIHVNI